MKITNWKKEFQKINPRFDMATSKTLPEISNNQVDENFKFIRTLCISLLDEIATDSNLEKLNSLYKLFKS